MTKVADLAARQMSGIASVERFGPQSPEADAGARRSAPVPPERIKRYTAELPEGLHKKLRHYIVEEACTAYAVNTALVTLLVSDEAIAERVRELLRQ